jgi:hypothetical protein
LPVPDDPEVIVRNPSLLTACQPHPAGADTFTAPSPPSAGYDWFVGSMTRGGFDAVTFTPEELLPLTGSRKGAVTDAEFAMLWPSETVQLRLATMLMVADAPDDSELKETVRFAPEPPHTPPAVEEHDTNVSEAGRLSVTVIDDAESGPLLTRVIVYVTLLPTTIVGAEAVLVTPRSAAPYDTHAENSEVLPSGFVDVAVIDSPGKAEAASVKLNAAFPAPFVVVVAEPRNVRPSPFPDRSHDELE